MTVSTPQTLPTTGTWSIDSMHSTVAFSLRHHAVATFRSSFTNISGAYDGDAQTLTGQVAVADITLAGLDQLKGHIMTKDFFSVEEFPVLTFKSTQITESGPELAVVGEITLRGVAKPVTAVGSFSGPRLVHSGDGSTAERIGIDLTTTIDRRHFGMDWNNEVSEGVTNLGWNVKIDAALELVLAAG